MAAQGTSYPIPAICCTPRCGAIWFAGGIVQTGHNDSKLIIQMEGCVSSPCPKCGGEGLIPDGEYTATKAKIYDPELVEKVRRALEALKLSASNGASGEAISKEITRSYPFLDGLKKALVPKSPSDTAQLLGVFIAAAALLNQCNPEAVAPTAHPTDVYLQTELLEALRRARGEQHDDAKSKTPRPQSEAKDTPEKSPPIT